MIRKICSVIYLVVGIAIGLTSLGHAIPGVRPIHAALDSLPVPPDVASTLYVVWYFVSGCMVVFGLTIVWTWFRLKKGETSLLFVSKAISLLYFVTGVGGLIANPGEAYLWASFIVESVLLSLSAHVLTTRPIRLNG